MRICAVPFAVGLLAMASSAALAGQPACGHRADIVDRLKATYNESHRASGLESDTKMIEIWTSESSGTWTILVTQASGLTCIAAAGKAWLDMPQEIALSGTAG